MTGEAWIDDNGDGDCDPGEGIEYVISILNEGTVTLSSTQISDDLLGSSWDCGDASQGGVLAPNEGMTCMGVYQVRVKRLLVELVSGALLYKPRSRYKRPEVRRNVGVRPNGFDCALDRANSCS